MLRVMLIRLEGEAIEAAVERVRKRGGDRDWKAAVTRVVFEADGSENGRHLADAWQPSTPVKTKKKIKGAKS